MKLIPCNEKYWEFVRHLRNDPDNLAGFINTKYITEADQQLYMAKYNNCYYICIDDADLPVGFIGSIDDDIRICVKNDRKNQGIGTFMINEFLKIQNQHKLLIAKVKCTNIISQKLFQKVGFKPTYIIYTKE